MDIDALSYSPELHNKSLQELHCNGLCQYNKSCKAYLFEKSNHVVKCSHMLIFLRQSTCYIITHHTHQWYKINVNEIFHYHTLVLCDDQSAHIVPLPTTKPPAVNTFTTIAKLTLLQAQDGQISDNCKQTMYSYIQLVNQTTKCSHQNQDVHSHNQSTVILSQFSITTQELKNFMDKVSGDLNKITQACMAAPENTSNLIENSISQALARPQDSIPREAKPPGNLELLDQTEHQTNQMR